jgi:hypothetical protein
MLFSFAAFSQEPTVLSGNLMTTKPLTSPVHIINLTQEKGNLSELSGAFSVEVNIGDVLLFSSVQYKKVTFKVTRENLNPGNFTIKLTEDLTELDEVKLHNLSGNLARDISGIKTFNKFSLNAPMARKPPPTQLERQIFTATTGPGGSKLSLLGVLTGRIPLAPIMNEINGSLDRLKQRQEHADLRFTVEKAIYIVSEHTFIEVFKIPKNQIRNFVYYCAENYQLQMLLENPLELHEFFRSKSSEFKTFISLD